MNSEENFWGGNMSDTKIRNDASSSTDGIVYQLYIALKYAFELPANRKLFIEKFGDVTLEYKSQIEVKKYQDKLTDTHENLWNTLLNWLDEKFNIEPYENLILLTTQSVGERSELKNWNSKSVDEKLEILDEIRNKYSKRKKRDPSKVDLLNIVLKAENTTKLKNILEKFIIISSNPDDVELYNQLCLKYARNIPPENQDTYISSLLGYLIRPKGDNQDKWEITCEDFNNECQKLAQLLIDNENMFPRIECNKEIKYDEYKEHLFVKKIEEIEHYKEIKDAIREYSEVHSLLINDFLTRQLSKKKYNDYADELLRSHKRSYRRASRGIREDNCIEESKNFYDDSMINAAPVYMTYIDTPKKFRNGILHMIADEANDNIKWKLGDDNV
jgi:hypothetical protein